MLENMTSRTWKQRVVVYTRRVIGMIMSAAILVAAGYIIGLLTVTSSSLEKSIAETDFSPFAAFIVRAPPPCWQPLGCQANKCRAGWVAMPGR